MRGIVLFIVFLLFVSCSTTNKIDVRIIREGEIEKNSIQIRDLLDSHFQVSNHFIDTISFAVLDSISFKDNNPDRIIVHSTPVSLDFSKKIKTYSPEYYSVSTVYYMTRCMNYYESLFANKIRFNSQIDYKTIKILFGDVPLITSPKNYIYEKRAPFSPSIIYHEIGHRAFWFIESDLGVKFKGLTYIHVGLLEYFTVSLNDSPVVGESGLPENLVRHAEYQYQYPLQDSLFLGHTLKLIKNAYMSQIIDSTNNISKYYNLTQNKYKHLLFQKVDNHRAGLVITSTLWRIRKQIGAEKTDKLIASTILDLNKFMGKRSKFYVADAGENVEDNINWYDLYYGLIDKDKELFKGVDQEIITASFGQTGFPVHKVKIER
jgi:hypothetical protein